MASFLCPFQRWGMSPGGEVTRLPSAMLVLVAQQDSRSVHLERAGGTGERVNDSALRAVSCVLQHLQPTGVTSLSDICSCQPQHTSIPNVPWPPSCLPHTVLCACATPPTPEINSSDSDYPESPLLWSNPFTGLWIAIRRWITALFSTLCGCRAAPSKRLSLCVDASAVCVCICVHVFQEFVCVFTGSVTISCVLEATLEIVTNDLGQNDLS